MSSESELRKTLIERLNKGDEDAIAKLYHAFSGRLVEIAGKNIHPALLKRFDGEDVVQSVFRTFFRRQAGGQYSIDNSTQLWKLLVTITIFKTRSQARRHRAAKRNAHVESPSLSHIDFLDTAPTPDSALALWEEVDVVLEGLPQKASDILAARLEGQTKTEIAENLNISRQTVHRICKLLEQRLQERFQALSSPE